MFRPPIARGMRVLDRSFFRKTIPLKAARIFDNKNISQIRSRLERARDALYQERLGSVFSDPDPELAKTGKKCVLLRPENDGVNDKVVSTHVTANSASSLRPYSSILSEMVNEQLISIVPYDLHLDYNYWTYHDIISAILPLEAQDEIPSGFSQVGHVAHLNLRDNYLPYKDLIATILLDKNPTVHTVINKIDDVGEENEYRTFKYEVLAGPDDMQVEVSEEGCIFTFDYSKVYWNPRLNTEHKRLVSLFNKGNAVCDVMAGVGPFAVPAGKKGVFVWANDLNPDSYSSLTESIKRNKVGSYVQSFNANGHQFIREAPARLLATDQTVTIKARTSRNHAKAEPEVLTTVVQPRTFQHFVLNLPASALTFLPSFIGLYTPDMREKLPSGTKMPLVHVYCFSSKDELNDRESQQKDSAGESETNGALSCSVKDSTIISSAEEKICAEISGHLHHIMHPGKIEEGGVEIYDVRDVAPKKRMFCASFRIPEDVAFRSS